jgi:hypothetical protein
MVRNLVVAAMYLAAALTGAYYVRALENTLKRWPQRKRRLLQVGVMLAWLYMAYILIEWLKV